MTSAATYIRRRFRARLTQFIPALALAAVFSVPSAQASPLCTSLGSTLNNFLGKTCQVGDVLFSFASNAYTYLPGDAAVPASSVQVSLEGNGTPGSLTGFEFSASDWKDTGNASSGLLTMTTADINISFNVSFAPLFNATGYFFNKTTLSINPKIQNPDGMAAIGAGETITDQNSQPLSPINLTILGNNDGQSEGLGGTALSGSSDFSATGLSVNKDLSLQVAENNNYVQVNNFTELVNFTNVPEPGPFVLMAIGLGLVFVLRQRKRAVSVLGAFVVLLVAGSGRADATPVCLTQSLNNYLSSGYECTIGDILFSNFSYFPSGSNDYSTPSTSNISVNVENSGGDKGFELVTNWITASSGVLNITFSFDAQTSSNNVIGFAASDTASEVTCANPTHAPPCTEHSTITGSATLKNGATTLASESFNYPTTGGATSSLLVTPGPTLSVSDTLHLSSTGGGGLANGAHISNLVDTLQESVPEPADMSLVGGALLALGLLGRRFRLTR